MSLRRSARQAAVQEEMEIDAEEDSNEEEQESEEESDHDGNMDDEEAEDENVDEDQEDETSSVGSRDQTPDPQREGKGKGNASKSRSKKENEPPSSKFPNLHIPMEEMIQNTVLYLLLMHHKRVPIKRGDIIKNALNGQQKSFQEVVDKTAEVLVDKFGIHLVGVGDKKPRSNFNSYILTTKYTSFIIESATELTVEATEKRNFMYQILMCILMSDHRSIEEDAIWKIHNQLRYTFCKKRDNLRHFLRSEFSSSGYLEMNEIRETENIICKYKWGPRSFHEFYKYYFCKYVGIVMRKKCTEFGVPYGEAAKSEKDIIDADSADESDEEVEEEETPASAAVQTVHMNSQGEPASYEMKGGVPDPTPTPNPAQVAASSPRSEQFETASVASGLAGSVNGRSESEGGSSVSSSAASDDENVSNDGEVVHRRRTRAVRSDAGSDGESSGEGESSGDSSESSRSSDEEVDSG